MLSSFDLNNVPEEEKGPFLEFRARVEGTNISSQTLLATDYLNHFNEIVMLLEMVPDMPDLLEEAREWEPKTYQEFVGASTFSDRELAVEAYNYVPTILKEPFETTISQIDSTVAMTIDRLDEDIQIGDMELLKINADGLIGLIRRLIDHASGVIHGSLKTMDQGEIDDMLAMGCAPADGAMAKGGPCGAASQAAIDAMFDGGGDDGSSSQADIDALFDNPPAKPKEQPAAEAEEKEKKEDGSINQADIDALFD